jgi:hypothetical protein
MFPAGSPHNRIQGRGLDAVLTAQCAHLPIVASPSAANLTHLIGAQFGVYVAFAVCPSTPLLITIFSVLILCAKSKMIWAHAGGYVTHVHDNQVIGDRAKGHLVTQSVRARSGITNFDPTIAELINAALPQPARIGFMNVLPEAAVRALFNGFQVTREAFRGIMGLHTKHPFVCHASGCLQQRGGFVLPGL